jgi:hypothetical protein
MNLETSCDSMEYNIMCLASVLRAFTQIQSRGWVQMRSKRFDHYQKFRETI